ncbi:MAG: peptidylprolyl isomerase [Planctomycetota bacterium]|nr:peptidylprolyl isomerase [Planctomycetota bacterium]
MSNKKFNTLVIVTIALVVVSILMSGKKEMIVAGFVRGQDLIGYLDIDKLDRVEVQKGDEKVVAQKQGNRFVVENRSSYPADGGRINNLIDMCLKVKCVREISDAADTHVELGVDEGNAESVVVKFRSGDKDLAAFIVGKKSDKGEFVRRLGESKVYLSEEVLQVSSDTLEYVDRSLSNLDRERVQKVEMVGNGQPIIISKTKDDKIVLAGIPEGMMEQVGVPDRVLHMLCQLSFLDFMSEADAKQMNFKFTYKCSLDSGELYTYKLAKKKDKWYAKASAEYTGPESLSQEQVAKGKEDPKVQKLNEAILQASKKIKAFNNRNRSWVYEFDGWIAENMTKAFADMIEEDKDFLKIQESAIQTVEVTPVQGKSYVVQSPKEGEVSLVGIPETKKIRGSEYQLVFTAAKTLRWESHKPPKAEEVRELGFNAHYKMTLRDGACYEFKSDVGTEGGQWVKASATYVGDGKDANAAVLAKAAIEKFNSRHSERVYKVASTENMTRRFRTLVQDKGALPEEVRACHILVAYKGAERSTATRTKEEARKLAESLHMQLVKDASKFEELVNSNSDCSSKSKGGDLGKFKFESMAKPFSEAAFGLQIGAMSGVVETEFGFHVIKRTE